MRRAIGCHHRSSEVISGHHVREAWPRGSLRSVGAAACVVCGVEVVARLKFARSRQYLDAGQARFVGGQFGGAHHLHQRRHAASIGGVHVRIVLKQECHVRHDAVRASDVQSD